MINKPAVNNKLTYYSPKSLAATKYIGGATKYIGASQPASSEPASQPADSEPASQPASQPAASQPASQTSQPTDPGS